MQEFETVKYEYRVKKDGLDSTDLQVIQEALIAKHKAKKVILYDEPTMKDYIIEIEAEE